MYLTSESVIILTLFIHNVLLLQNATTEPAKRPYAGDEIARRSIVKRARVAARGVLPNNVNNIQQNDLSDHDQQTLDGERWIIAEGELLGFATAANVRYLAAANRWYMDGSFKVAPVVQENGYCQIFSIHASVNGLHVPLAFFLLRTKELKHWKYV